MKLVVETDESDIDEAVKRYLAEKGLVAVERSLMEDIAARDRSHSHKPTYNIYYSARGDSYSRTET